MQIGLIFFNLGTTAQSPKAGHYPTLEIMLLCVCSSCSGHIQGPKLELALYFIYHLCSHNSTPWLAFYPLSSLTPIDTPKSLINPFLLPFSLTILEVLVRNLVQSTHL